MKRTNGIVEVLSGASRPDSPREFSFVMVWESLDKRPKVELLDPETGAFLPPGDIVRIFKRVGADKAHGHVAYCGGAIFATVVAFWLHQLGHNNVAVYENSMSEWGPDQSLPIETG